MFLDATQWEGKATKVVQRTWVQILAMALPRFVIICKSIRLPFSYQRLLPRMRKGLGKLESSLHIEIKICIEKHFSLLLKIPKRPSF